jgi:nicotinamide-nucleotide amidase
MNAEILCVGTELLLGDIVNTNAAYIARGLAALGINVYRHTVVGDNPQRLKNSLEEAFARADLVLTTGGLGPTYDDLTKETVAARFGRRMVMNEQCLAQIEAFFARTGRPMTDNNRKQAEMPEGAIVLPNPHGTAPGCIVEDNGKAAILMPGPPREMMPMFDGPVREYLGRFVDGVLVSRSVHLFGVGESTVEDRLRDLMVNSTNPTVAPYAKQSELTLRVTARAPTREEGYRLIGPAVSRIMEEFGNYVYGLDAVSLQQTAVELLGRKGLRVAVAESCTGGLVSGRLTEIPGASRVFECGVCAYADEIKIKLLGVGPDTLRAEGAVSRQTALEMARGVRALSGADIGVATTGIAGPGGASAQKPVGLVYVAVSGPIEEQCRELKLARGRGDDRELIRYAASSYALDMVIRAARAL